MMKTFGVIVLACLAVGGSTSDGAVLISQYYEGTSGTNRALEIWNTGTETVDFSATALVVSNYTNGSTTASSTLSISSGTLAPNAVIVITNTETAGDTALAAAGVPVFYDASGMSAMNYNGDDAVSLTVGGTVMDIIGQIGLDPGTSWDVNGVSTANQNIQLKSPLLITGDTDGTTTYDPSARYEFVSAGNVTTESFQGFGVAPGAIPEPSSLAFVGVGILGLARRRRARLA